MLYQPYKISSPLALKWRLILYVKLHGDMYTLLNISTYLYLRSPHYFSRLFSCINVDTKFYSETVVQAIKCTQHLWQNTQQHFIISSAQDICFLDDAFASFSKCSLNSNQHIFSIFRHSLTTRNYVFPFVNKIRNKLQNKFTALQLMLRHSNNNYNWSIHLKMRIIAKKLNNNFITYM